MLSEVSVDRELPKPENIPLQISGIKDGYVPIQILALLESMLYKCAKMGDLLYTMFCLFSSKSLGCFFHYVILNHFDNTIKRANFNAKMLTLCVLVCTLFLPSVSFFFSPFMA